MKHKYSLVHLTCFPAHRLKFIRTAAAAGYDYVSLRTISMQLPNEIPHYLTDPVLRGGDQGGQQGDRGTDQRHRERADL